MKALARFTDDQQTVYLRMIFSSDHVSTSVRQYVSGFDKFFNLFTLSRLEYTRFIFIASNLCWLEHTMEFQ